MAAPALRSALRAAVRRPPSSTNGLVPRTAAVGAKACAPPFAPLAHTLVAARGFASQPPKKPDDHPYVNKGARYLPGFSFPAPRNLKDIVKMQLLERESTHHIRDIWLDHHSERGDTVADTMTVTEYRELSDRGRKWCVSPSIHQALPPPPPGLCVSSLVE